jgi:phage antirepressor YoqD-like protein
MSFRQVAKLLQAKETDFRLFLIESGILYRQWSADTAAPAHCCRAV